MKKNFMMVLGCMLLAMSVEAGVQYDDFNDGSINSGWTTFQNGCSLSETGGEFRIQGTTVQSGWGHESGLRTYFAWLGQDDDFEAAVDFSVPQFSGSGTRLIYLNGHASTGGGFGLFYSYGHGYRVQTWTPSQFSTWLRPLGDERSTFHRMKLVYRSASQTLTGYVDDILVGSLKIQLSGNISLSINAASETAGMVIDTRFDNFESVKNPIKNLPPVADAGGPYAASATGADGAIVSVDGLDSLDPDGDTLTYEWDLDLSFDSDLDGNPSNDVDETESMADYIFLIGQTEISLAVRDDEGLSSEPDITTVTVSYIDVAIDIKPGSYPNTINMGSQGVVPVAFLSDESFDALTINPLTVTLWGADSSAGLVQLRGKNAKPMASAEDVDGDGDLDLLVKIATEDLIGYEIDTLCEFSALTYDGYLVSGADTIHIVPLGDHAGNGGSWPTDPTIVIINPDHYRTLKMGALRGDGPVFYSLAQGEAPDRAEGGWIAYSNYWTNVGTAPDFIGSLLESEGYGVEYYEASSMPDLGRRKYAAVIVQDPLREHRVEYLKSTENDLPDYLDHCSDPAFLSKIDDYVRSGGNLILVGDAVRLVEDGPGRLNYGKSVQTVSPLNVHDVPDSRIPDHWLFIRGNPFCGRDRNGSGEYFIENSPLLPQGKMSDVTLFNGNDAHVTALWSESVYSPADATSLMDVGFYGAGEYVLSGAVCNPPIYLDTVNVTFPNYMGYTDYGKHRIFYIGSDSLFDYTCTSHAGAWHARQYLEISNTLTDLGKEAIIKLVETAME